ncbi:DUF3422 family protein [Aestuariirhabdus litorea]|uniref:DUF3422 domain-containing protein n=1 Tax=Aestuariirhabdus litorea TaxID=2528527 RepID=A0A3P3VQ13_9GAMM|nr:DUF3422 domain-containing protein [Aestuariirhabdus litorea]RRJ84815.1 DUF3422 domain-containing protein [Aestuariirhabdus litorea]RWW98040.1 DUF3422 family protein [Endozoicomonadaceae bacterium GTF-13]
MTVDPHFLGEFRLPVHPLREQLYNELHARPFPVVESPALVSHMAILSGEGGGRREVEHIARLCLRYALPQPDLQASALYLDFGDFHLRWERHTEFSAYTFIRPFKGGKAMDEKAIDVAPREWLESIAGEVVTALHGVIEAVQEQEMIDGDALAEELFDGERAIGSYAIGRRAMLCTSFRLHRGGFGRFYIANYSLSPQRAGRLLQRMLEIESYRVMALLSLPLARKISPRLAVLDAEVAKITARLADKGADSAGDRQLLASISALAAEVEQYRSDTSYRFAASKAYSSLVHQRLDYVEEEPIEHLQMISHFFARRFTPAMDTCEAVASRLEELSQRLARAGELLGTQVDLAIEQQNQRLLASMNRRGKLQLRLQETVEGLSVVVISYHLVGLLKYLFDAAKPLGLEVNTPLLLAASVVPVVLGVWWLMRKIRKRLTDKTE